MENLTFNVRDIDPGDRVALEHIIGQPLHDNLQLIIQVVGTESANLPPPASETTSAELPDWCDVYAGLSDDEIAAIEKVVLTRMDLGRPLE